MISFDVLYTLRLVTEVDVIKCCTKKIFLFLTLPNLDKLYYSFVLQVVLEL